MSTASSNKSHGRSSRGDAAASLRLASAWIALFVFWLLLSGFFTPFLVIAGGCCAAAVVWLCKRMAVFDREGHPIHIALRAVFWYWPWLAKEIVKSAWQVTCIILHPRLPVSPTLVRFKPSQSTDLGRVIHANSITLTPGTITVEARSDEFLVHGVTRGTAQGTGAGSDMDQRVARLERGS